MQCHRSRIDKKTYETYRQCIIHHFAKTQISYNSCSKHSLTFASFQQLTPRNFSFVQNKRSMKVSWRCFHTKVQNISKFKCYMSDTLIQTGHTIASTCNWLCGGSASPVLIWQANIYVRFTWTSFDDCANPTITVKHIERRQLGN